MKSIKKFLFIMAALAAVLAFVSCSNGDDGGASSNNSNNNSNNSADNNNDSNTNNSNGNSNNVAKPSVIATYESDDGLELTFLGDGKGTGTWSVVEYIQSNKIIWAQGTFEGFPEKNSTIDITWKEY